MEKEVMYVTVYGEEREDANDNYNYTRFKN